MSSQDDTIRKLREENERVKMQAYEAEQDSKRANDAYIILEKDLMSWQEKYEQLENEKKIAEAEVETWEKDYKFMEKHYLKEKGRWEKAEHEVVKLQVEKDEVDEQLRREQDAHQGTRRRYNNLTQDIEGRIQQVEEDTKANQEKERKEKGLVLVNAAEHETYKTESQKTDEVNAELVALKKQLAHYERNEMASKFPYDLPSSDDFDDFAPSTSRRPPLTWDDFTRDRRKTSLPRTFDEEVYFLPPTEGTTDTGTQTKEGLELGPVKEDSGTQTEARAVFSQSVQVGQPTGDASTQLGGPRADTGTQIGGQRVDAITQIGGPSASTGVQTVEVEDPKASTADSDSESEFTTTIGGMQNTSPDVPPTVTRDSGAQVGDGKLTTTIGGAQSTALVGDKFNIIEVIKDRVIHHHSIAGCFWHTTRNMIIISRKVAERMPTSFTNPLPAGFNLPGVFRRGGLQQGLDADGRTNDNPPLLVILENPDIVDMPPIWQTVLDFFSYLCFFIFLYQCYVARAWVTEMMANNGLYRSYFSDLYTHHAREGRGIIPTVFSEGVARFAEQFTLTLVRHLGIELETYPMPG